MKVAIPSYMKYILEYCGYDNCHTIATIEENDLEYFKNEVKEGKVTNFFEAKIGPKNVLEGSSKSVDDFEFSRGHQKLLMAVVKLVKENLNENGVDSFSQELPSESIIPTKRKIENKVDKKIYSKKQKCSTNKLTSIENARLIESSSTATLGNSDIELQKHRSTLMKKMALSLINHSPENFANVSIIKMSSS